MTPKQIELARHGLALDVMLDTLGIRAFHALCLMALLFAVLAVVLEKLQPVEAQTRLDLTRAVGFPGLSTDKVATDTIRVGGGCSTTNPCNVRFGNTLLSIVSSWSLRLANAGKGTVTIALDRHGVLRVFPGVGIAVVCPGSCVVGAVAPGVTTVPLALWDVAGGAWLQGLDLRGHLPYSPGEVRVGLGLIGTVDAYGITISLDPAVLPTVP